MKKGLLSLAILIGASSLLQAKGTDDPVLMTVGGHPVTLSEFEYLYHKNNAQQSTPQAIEEYMQLFIPYRQKVAAAEAKGIDKTPAFQREFTTYRNDLSAPYLIDTAVQDSIYRAAYERMKEDVDVSHIMLFFESPDMTLERKRELMDSILNCLNNGESFDSLAFKYSEDRRSAERGGHMAWISANNYPVAFEEAAYAAPVGGYSGVIESPVGLHIVKALARRPARGQVLVEHILRLTRGKSDEEVAAQKQYIDSIYNLAVNGGNFEELAKANSDDPGSARDGGKLPWFGPGKMVPEFEEVSFTLADGEISKPFSTSYGYHIVKRLDGRGIDSYEDALPAIRKAVNRDERSLLPGQRRLDQLKKEYKASLDRKAIEAVEKAITDAGRVDSTMLADIHSSKTVIGVVDGQKFTLGEAISKNLPNGFAGTPEMQVKQLNDAIDMYFKDMILDHKRDLLMKEEPSYRNLVNEYRDGMLMFEIQDRNVWSKAKNDTEGLKKYFEANKGKYIWDAPRYKARVIFAKNDSILQAVNKYLVENNVASDSLATTLRAQFGHNVKVERVLAAKGENAITDYLGFGGEKPEAPAQWPVYMAWQDRLIEQPEEVADVRGQVITDYQDYLLEQWVKELAKEYPAKINKKVLSKAK